MGTPGTTFGLLSYYYLLVFVSGARMMGSSRKLLVLLAGTRGETQNFVCLSIRVRVGRPDSDCVGQKKKDCMLMISAMLPLEGYRMTVFESSSFHQVVICSEL